MDGGYFSFLTQTVNINGKRWLSEWAWIRERPGLSLSCSTKRASISVFVEEKLFAKVTQTRQALHSARNILRLVSLGWMANQIQTAVKSFRNHLGPFPTIGTHKTCVCYTIHLKSDSGFQISLLAIAPGSIFLWGGCRPPRPPALQWGCIGF